MFIASGSRELERLVNTTESKAWDPKMPEAEKESAIYLISC